MDGGERRFIPETMQLHQQGNDGFHREMMMAALRFEGPLDLENILKIMQSAFPFEPQWMTFAADVADLYSTRGHFVEKTDQAHGFTWVHWQFICIHHDVV